MRFSWVVFRFRAPGILGNLFLHFFFKPIYLVVVPHVFKQMLNKSLKSPNLSISKP